LPLEVVPLASADLNRESDRISVPESFYECHVGGLPQCSPDRTNCWSFKIILHPDVPYGTGSVIRDGCSAEW
jgi:hypothetical protein